jgi:hypothetical protein
MVLATGSKLASSNPAEDDGFLSAIKIRNTTSLRGEAKPSAYIVIFYSTLKNLVEYERDILSAKFTV